MTELRMDDIYEVLALWADEHCISANDTTNLSIRLEEEIRPALAILTKKVKTLTEDLDEAEAGVRALMDCADKDKATIETLRVALEDLEADAQDLCDHEIDGGAPDNRWEDLRAALIRTSKVVEIPR